MEGDPDGLCDVVVLVTASQEAMTFLGTGLNGKHHSHHGRVQQDVAGRA